MNGAHEFDVPVGWTVDVRFRNRDSAPYSARVVPPSTTYSLTLAPPAFADAETSRADVGIRSRSGG